MRLVWGEASSMGSTWFGRVQSVCQGGRGVSTEWVLNKEGPGEKMKKVLNS